MEKVSLVCTVLEIHYESEKETFETLRKLAVKDFIDTISSLDRVEPADSSSLPANTAKKTKPLVKDQAAAFVFKGYN